MASDAVDNTCLLRNRDASTTLRAVQRFSSVLSTTVAATILSSCFFPLLSFACDAGDCKVSRFGATLPGVLSGKVDLHTTPFPHRLVARVVPKDPSALRLDQSTVRLCTLILFDGCSRRTQKYAKASIQVRGQ